VLVAAVARKVIELEEQPFYCNAAVDEFGLLNSPSDMNMALPVLPEDYRRRRVNMVPQTI
jgi:hypothetical protein